MFIDPLIRIKANRQTVWNTVALTKLIWLLLHVLPCVSRSWCIDLNKHWKLSPSHRTCFLRDPWSFCKHRPVTPKGRFSHWCQKACCALRGELAHWTGPFQHLWQVDNCRAAFWIHNNDSATFDRCPSSRNAGGKHYHLGWLFREKVPQRLDICTQNHKLLETTADLAVWAHSAEVSRSSPLPPLDTGRSYQRDAFTSFSHTLPTLRWFLCSDPHTVRNTGQSWTLEIKWEQRLHTGSLDLRRSGAQQALSKAATKAIMYLNQTAAASQSLTGRHHSQSTRRPCD